MRNLIGLNLLIGILIGLNACHYVEKNDNVAQKEEVTEELKMEKEEAISDVVEVTEKKKYYTEKVLEPLVRIDGCDYPVSGVVQYIKDGRVVALLDYGNGECDDIAMKTVGYKTVEVKLSR